jgi:1-acyl-sn-glycerol-3-phosphate acyltransferase
LARPGSRLWSTLYGSLALVVFGILLAVGSLLALILPGMKLRRALTRALARLGLLILGLRVSVTGVARLPATSCIVVANHASYLDGVVLKAVLPPRFSFVIKREAARYPFAGLLLQRIGSEFVDRVNPGGRQSDARRVVRRAEAGHSLVFFPEGTFTAEPGLRRFHVGAFVAAARGGTLDGSAVDVGSGELVTIRALVDRLATLVGGDVQPVFGARADRPAEREPVADVTRTEQLLGWTASTSLDAGLARTVEWFRARHAAGQVPGRSRDPAE